MKPNEQINLMERALREILLARRPGPTPKLIDGSLIERIENIARAAIEQAGSAETCCKGLAPVRECQCAIDEAAALRLREASSQ